MIEQVGNGEPGACEAPNAAKLAGTSIYRAALGPVHKRSLPHNARAAFADIGELHEPAGRHGHLSCIKAGVAFATSRDRQLQNAEWLDKLLKGAYTAWGCQTAITETTTSSWVPNGEVFESICEDDR